jgi:two-component system sensor histidine kinase QseC
MSLQRRLLLYLLLSAPLVWVVALVASVQFARHEINELYDSEMIRLAREVQATLGPAAAASAAAAVQRHRESADTGAADIGDLAIAVWSREGHLLNADREGVLLPYRPQGSGFADLTLAGEAWRVYYLQSFEGDWLVAAGQKAYERDELVYDLTLSQLVPWLLVLPVLLFVMALAVRRALAPVRRLADELHGRSADDLRQVPPQAAPAELTPLVQAMNGLFSRVGELIAHERRFTADAAHELRTPLAVLRAQWDVVRRAGEGAQRAEAEAKFAAGLDRLDRLVQQLLAMSRLEAEGQAMLREEVRWPPIVEQAMSDCLALAERRRIELVCEWPPGRQHALPLLGDAALLTVMLRNLLDNAARYAPAGSQVVLRFAEGRVEVDNAGPRLQAQQLARLGERFYRPEGQEESGSGLGLSIARRVAALHGLVLEIGARDAAGGVRVTLRFARPAAAAPAAQ